MAQCTKLSVYGCQSVCFVGCLTCACVASVCVCMCMTGVNTFNFVLRIWKNSEAMLAHLFGSMPPKQQRNLANGLRVPYAAIPDASHGCRGHVARFRGNCASSSSAARPSPCRRPSRPRLDMSWPRRQFVGTTMAPDSCVLPSFFDSRPYHVGCAANSRQTLI